MFYADSTKGFYLPEIHGNAIPDDAVEISDETYLMLLSGQSSGKRIASGANGKPVLKDIIYTKGQVISALRDVVQAHIDASAVAAGYDNMIEACSYADEAAVPKFRSEARALRAWRSQVRAALQAVIADIKAGTREAPSAAELIAALPVLVMS